MNKYKRVTIKIGSNVLTRADGTLNVTRLSSLVDQIATLRRHGIEVVLVSSGAVACGRSELKDDVSAKMSEVDQRQIFSAVGQVKLINRYYDFFGAHGLHVGQVLTLKESFATRNHYLNQRNCMMVMLRNGVIPVVNENDTVSLTELMFTDNDELSGLIASMLGCDALVILSNIDGIYTSAPGTPGSEVIRLIEPGSDFSGCVSAARSGLGRGGMKTKYRVARKVADEGIEVIIANGATQEILPKLLLDDTVTALCTRFVPSPEPTSTLKRWLAHSEGFAKGRIILNDNAVETLKSDGAASVLAVGITAVEGDFEKDEIITIADKDGTDFGVGRIAFDSDYVKQNIGVSGLKPLIRYEHIYIN